MAARELHLHVLCSAKGGVGKSTLAVTCARLLAAAGEKTLLLDADLTGTSLADGLRLCAPDTLDEANGSANLLAAPKGRLSRAETVALRNRRKASQREDFSPPPPFLNDALISVGPGGAECHIPALVWCHEREDGVLYVPSSPLQRDIEIALGWLYREEPFAFAQRLAWFLDGARTQDEDLRHFVIDLPPGLFGFAHETLALVSSLAGNSALPSGFPVWSAEELLWRANPMLVTSLDRNDMVVAIDYFLAHREELPGLRLVLNRYTQGRWASLREALQFHLRDVITPDMVERLLDQMQSAPVADLGALRNIFSDGELSLNEDVLQLSTALGLKGRK